MSWTKSAIVGSEILTLFVNTLTTDDMYSRRNMLNFTQQLEAPLPQKQKIFSGLFLVFLKCELNLKHLEKKMSILAELFRELLTPKEVVT